MGVKTIYSRLNNNMRLTTGMMSYPVFPDWIFVDTLALDRDIRDNLINEMMNQPRAKTHHGWSTPKKNFTPNLKALNQVIGSKFVDSVKYQFKLSGSLLNIEIAESWAHLVNSGHCVPATIQHHRWYQCVYFLNVDHNSSGIYFEDTTAKRQITAEGVQEFYHMIDPEPDKIVFFPAHITNGLTENFSKNPALYIISTFVMKS